MTNSNTTIDEKYNEAIQSLKKINNDLFYDELKKLIHDREQTISELNKEVYESIEKMQESIKSFPVQVSEQLKEEVVNRQSKVFDRGMERFDENIAVLEKKISYWDHQYHEFLEKTEKLLADAKGFQQEDQEFIARETERVLSGFEAFREQLTDSLSEQAATLNVKYDVVSERLGVILQELMAVEENHKAELEQLNQQLVRDHKNLQDKWEEKLKLVNEASVKREGLLKKWLIGLAVGQGVSVVMMVLFFIMK